MRNYILKRVAQMVPVLLGVLLLTFTLFHAVGGSPAADVLGQNASAQALEEYDEQNGFNRPLLWGRWVATRALADRVAPPGTDAVGRAAPGAPLALPLPCALRPATRYRLELDRAGDGPVRARLRHGPAPDETADGTAGPRGRLRFEWVTGPGAGPTALAVEIEDGALAVRGLALRRAVAHPWDSQLLFYLRRLLRLDLGVSSETHQQVAAILRQGVLPSLSLTVPMFLGGLAGALVLALGCAYFRDRWADRLTVLLATLLMSVNYIVWVVAGQYLLAYRWGWFPIWGYESARYLVLPVLIGIASGLGRDVRFYRTVMLDEMYRDYVCAAAARGVRPGAILFRHVLRNALIPVITNVSLTIPFLFTGSLLLESFFGIPGLGHISLNAIHSSDLNVVQAVVLVGALLYLAVNLAADLCYAWADPRIRLE